ncbi:hypothetical protein [Hyphococcus luteus]|uniref:PEGA domain-containing protein n=1 Tax=Hyphococcus luteus TaxID=2058213 RepID=A0A2S7K027_9PROT|nr:hypothetical protein [Marinicaulis flavus]PQA85852.1 hypothetical protein CW354_20145 [Marinicaulis flavus]
MSGAASISDDKEPRSNVTRLARSGDALRSDEEEQNQTAADDTAATEDEISPAALEADNERSHANAAKRRRWIAGGLIIIAAASIVALAASYGPWTADEDRFAERMTAELDDVRERIDALEASDREAAVARTDLAAGADAVKRALRGLTADLATLEARLDTAESRDADSSEAIATVRQKLAETQTSLDAFSARLEKLPAPQSAARTSVITLSPSAPAPEGETDDSLDLPFTPVAIDLWAGAPQLAIRSKEGLAHLVAGETRQEWTLVSADRDAGAVILQSADGVPRRYVLGEGFADPLRAHPAEATLTVNATPADARIRVMNIKPIYAPQMPLAPGLYDIEVTAPGFRPHRQWIRIGDDAHNYKVTLEKSPERPS